MKDLKITYIPLHQIKPYGKNAKKHPIKQLQRIEDSIREYGFKQPVVIDAHNVIVAGHGRYEAAASLGIANIPCVVADDLTSTQIKAYRIIDNRIAQTDWDIELLKIDIEELHNEHFNIDALGFDPDELTDILYGEDVMPLDEDSKEKPTKEKKITCPKCEHEFIPL